MSHVRQQIRAAVVAALTPLGTVYTSRAWPIDAEALPVMLVYAQNEEIEAGALYLERRMQVVVEIVASGETYDDTIDALLVGIEPAVTGTLGGLVIDILPVAIEITASAEGATPIGRARCTFEAVYRTSHTDPETSI